MLRSPFSVMRRPRQMLRFAGVDFGGGIDTVPIIAEDLDPETEEPILTVRVPGATVYLGTGRGYKYSGVRYEVYRLVAGKAYPGEQLAHRLITFSPRAQAQKGGKR